MIVSADQTRRHERTEMPIYALGAIVPLIHDTAYVHPDAVVIGNVTIGAESTIWPGAVLRGDAGHIQVGERTSIQDGAVIHVTGKFDTSIGSDCVVGHLAHLEGCSVADDVLIGSGSVVLPGSVIQAGSLVAAGAVLPPDTQVPLRSMVRGVPAKVIPGVVAVGSFADTVTGYVERGRRYATELRRLD